MTTTKPNPEPPGRDMPPIGTDTFPKPKLMRLGRGGIQVERGGVAEVIQMKDVAHIAFLRDKREAFGGPAFWRSALPRQPLAEAAGSRN